MNLNWAPSADVNSNPANPVIGVRSFGADPDLVARHTAAYVTGLQSAGVAACTKHFPGHGDTAVDSHHALPRIDADLSVLHVRELVPFRAAIAAGSRAVMSAHILRPRPRPGPPRHPLPPHPHRPAARGTRLRRASSSPTAWRCGPSPRTYGIERGSVLAIAAGADAICVGGGLADDETVRRLRDALVTAVRNGELPEERLADAADRVRALAEWTAAAAASRPPTIGSNGSNGSNVPAAPLTASAAPSGSSAPAAPAARSARPTRSGRWTSAWWPPGARCGVTRSGRFTPFTEAPYVAALTPVANIAVGDETPWGVAAELARLLPGTETGQLHR